MFTQKPKKMWEITSQTKLIMYLVALVIALFILAITNISHGQNPDWGSVKPIYELNINASTSLSPENGLGG